jgi:hypothetical protein
MTRTSFGARPAPDQLSTLGALGYLDRAIDSVTTPKLPELTGTAPVADRALAYLHANCSHCHRPETGIAGGRLDLRYGESAATLAACTSSPASGVDDARIVVPGAPERSAIFLRMTDRARYQMPPLATLVVDTTASAAVEEWIRSLAPNGCE